MNYVVSKCRQHIHITWLMIAETEEDLIKRLNEWKNNVKNRGMRVNMNKTKVMISGERQKPVQKAARWPCGVCGRGQRAIKRLLLLLLLLLYILARRRMPSSFFVCLRCTKSSSAACNSAAAVSCITVLTAAWKITGEVDC